MLGFFFFLANQTNKKKNTFREDEQPLYIGCWRSKRTSQCTVGEETSSKRFPGDGQQLTSKQANVQYDMASSVRQLPPARTPLRGMGWVEGVGGGRGQRG